MRRDTRRAVAALLAAVLVIGALVLLVGSGDDGRGAALVPPPQPAATPSAAPPVSSPPSPAPAPSRKRRPAAAPDIRGWTTATAGGIRDSRGTPVRLLSVAEGRTNQCRPSPPDEVEAKTIAGLGFNSVRLSISWAATEPTPPTVDADGTVRHTWDESYLRLIDESVAQFQRVGLAVILDMHQVRLSSTLGGNTCSNVSMPSWVFAGTGSRGEAVCQFFTNTRAPDAPLPPHEAFAAVWQEYAERYASNSTVIAADVYNEPYVNDLCPGVHLERLPEFYGTIGLAIREVNPRLTLIFQDAAFEAYRKAGLQLTRLPPLANVIYSWHFYPSSWEEGLPGLQTHVDNARRLGAPLWIGEFDGFGLASNTGRRANPDAEADLAAMMEYCREHDVGWSLWEYRGTGSSLLDRSTRQPKQLLARLLQEGM